MAEASDVEKRAELTRVQAIKIDTTIGGLQIGTPADLEIISARLARGMSAVPPHVRNNPGVAFALCLQALEWRMPIMSVINKSYVVNNRGQERLAYESQLIHAIVERNAPIKGRLRHQIIGEGDERRCKVWGTFKGESKPHEYTSETLGKLREERGRNPNKGDAEDKEKGGVLKGSPLWESQPEVQLFYSASRTWARMYCPDVILGAYTPEDPWYSADMVDVTPKSVSELGQRLRDAKVAAADDRGFDVDKVAKIIEGEPVEETEDDGKQSDDATGVGKFPVEIIDRPDDDRDKKGRPTLGEEHQSQRQDAAREPAARAKGPPQEDRPDSSRGRRATEIPRQKGRR